jgi:4-amino-4-deoxy-L-arabinose transferase-like glycosyltransferase
MRSEPTRPLVTKIHGCGAATFCYSGAIPNWKGFTFMAALMISANGMQWFAFLLVGTIGFLSYFLPSICAFMRHHPQKISILLLNFFLGWSIVGWVIALVWAFKKAEPATVVVVQQPAPPYR